MSDGFSSIPMATTRHYNEVEMAITRHYNEVAELNRDPEKARCCPHPDFPALKKGAWAQHKQRCRTCGAWHYQHTSLPAVRRLEQHPFTHCQHEEVEPLELIGQQFLKVTAFQCQSCRLCWREQKPTKHQAGEDFETFFEQWMDEYMEISGLGALAREGASKKAAEAALRVPRPRASSLAG